MSGPPVTPPGARDAPERAADGWSEPRPAHVPRPTAWPMLCAAAVALLFFGVSSSPVVAAVGGLAFLVTLAGWIRELLHERRVARDAGR